MNTLLGALGLVFVAELGDKTQLVALGLGARHRLAPVVTGVAIAHAITTGLSVLLGEVADAALPTDTVSAGAGVAFLGFAALTLRAPDVGDDPGSEPARSGRAVVTSVAITMVLAELGDKTMLATATLAARGNGLMVWIGAVIGITAAGLVGVVAGRSIGDRLPQRAIRIGSSALFAVFGLILIVSGLT
ncbi:MAG: TMEM165/GDT1 family protein [Acidimicrobiales bacterium]